MPTSATVAPELQWHSDAVAVVDYNRWPTIFEFGALPRHMAMQVEVAVVAVLQRNAGITAAEWLGGTDYAFGAAGGGEVQLLVLCW